MKKIAIDMDGVLADVFTQFTRYHEADTGEKITVKDALGKSEHEPFEKASEYLLTPGFFPHTTGDQGQSAHYGTIE